MTYYPDNHEPARPGRHVRRPDGSFNGDLPAPWNPSPVRPPIPLNFLSPWSQMPTPDISYDPTPGRIRPMYTAPPPPRPTWSGFAITSLVLATVALSIFGLLLGILALGETGPGEKRGRGLAVAGILLSAAGCIAWLWFWVIMADRAGGF